MYYSQTGCELRTDSDFRARSQAAHHKEDSLLEALSIDMVRCFPSSDPLHLLELGVMKRHAMNSIQISLSNVCLCSSLTIFQFMNRFMLVWKFGDTDFKRIWSKHDIFKIDNRLKSFNKQKPREIHRAVRGIKDLKFWKGTEFRSFLLYYGVVVLKEFLPVDIYNHFLLLFCAVTICYSDCYGHYLQFAQKYFDMYIEGCITIYSEQSTVSNIHNLTHVVDDVKRFGNLNSISAYPFENRLHFLKLRLKQPRLPLEQITRRIVELSLDYEHLFFNDSAKANFPVLTCEYMLDGNLAYKQINIDSNCTLSVNRKADSWFLTKDREIVQMNYATSTNNSILIHGSPICSKEIFFKQPVSSSYLNIFKSNGILGNQQFFEYREIIAKMICLSLEEYFVFIPLSHTLKTRNNLFDLN